MYFLIKEFGFYNVKVIKVVDIYLIYVFVKK